MLGLPSKPKITAPKYLGENSRQEQYKHFCYTLALAVTALFSLEASEWQESGCKKEEIVRNCTIFKQTVIMLNTILKSLNYFKNNKKGTDLQPASQLKGGVQ